MPVGRESSSRVQSDRTQSSSVIHRDEPIRFALKAQAEAPRTTQRNASSSIARAESETTMRQVREKSRDTCGTCWYSLPDQVRRSSSPGRCLQPRAYHEVIKVRDVALARPVGQRSAGVSIFPTVRGWPSGGRDRTLRAPFCGDRQDASSNRVALVRHTATVYLKSTELPAYRTPLSWGAAMAALPNWDRP